MKQIEHFLKSESSSGILIIIALLLAMVAENTCIKPYYDLLLNTSLEIRIGKISLSKPILLWINDALMAVFFFLVGLELKREILIGQLSTKDNLWNPAAGAVLGIIVPALIYLKINQGNNIALNGWAIPTATDIAFALAVLSLLGNRVPKELKLLLLAIAIIDDIGAIAIIGIFYSKNLSIQMFIISGIAMILLLILNKRNVASAVPYLLVGIILWLSVLKSGVHATLAGILLAAFIPLNSTKNTSKSLLQKLENDLHGTVAFVILPVFAFANSGINFTGFAITQLQDPIIIGIICGLVLGKQIGVFLGIYLVVKLGISKLSKNISWAHIYGVSALCGIGFTMSLFISSLAFAQSNAKFIATIRLGILLGSVISATIGYLTLLVYSKRKKT